MSAMSSDNHEERSVSGILAKERTREAAERTLLAWIRTSLSLIIFGFGIYKVVHALSHDINHRHPMTVVLGLSFIVLGIFSMIAATAQHIQILGKLRLDDDLYKPKQALGLFVSIALTLIGMFALVTVIIEFFILKS
jgi:putative membrane protein